MKKPEERRASEESPGEQVEETAQDTSGRAAPIDEDVAGELNAALPDDEPESGSGSTGREPPSPRA